MKYTKALAGTLLLLAVSACSGNMAAQSPSLPPSGIKAAGSAGTTGGAAAAPAGVGEVGRTRY